MKAALIAVALAVALAAGAPAGARSRPSPKPLHFAVTVEGTLRTVWLEEAKLAKDNCTFEARTSGSKRIDFRSRRPTKVAASPRGALRRATLRFVAGEITRAGESGTSASPECSPVQRDASPPSVASFSNAVLTVSRARRGVLQLSQLAPEVEDQTSWAPAVFGERATPPLQRVLGGVDERKLANRRVKTIIAVAEYRNVIRLAGDEAGQLLQEVAWTLTFRRVGS